MGDLTSIPLLKLAAESGKKIIDSFRMDIEFFQKFYYIGIDVIFAGVLGLGVYFFLSGRVWCRFGCPLAALMHICSWFSRY